MSNMQVNCNMYRQTFVVSINHGKISQAQYQAGIHVAIGCGNDEEQDEIAHKYYGN